MSSTPANKDHYYASSIGKSRRSSPGDSQGIAFFQTGQGPSYSNAYTAPRSSPGRYDLTAQALYPTQWPTGNSPPLAPSFNYDMTTTHDRYSPQSAYAYSSRNSPPLSQSAADPRRLPPLATSSSPGGDRWQQSAYSVGSAVHGYANTTNASNIRSPAASYAQPYVSYQGSSQNSAYTYMPHDHLSMSSQGPATLFDEPLDHMRLPPRSTSPYRTGHSAHMSGSNYATPPPISPTSPEEPTIKKKRKRADAAQLKVLNETYARTAFPSTEERHSLAKALDMSARSVQIWFQNKRQSMRQTNRQSNTSSHQSYGVTSPQSERMMEESLPSHGHGHPSTFPGGQMASGETAFMAQPSVHDMPRSHTSHSSTPHRRFRSPEEPDSHKWPRGY